MQVLHQTEKVLTLKHYLCNVFVCILKLSVHFCQNIKVDYVFTLSIIRIGAIFSLYCSFEQKKRLKIVCLSFKNVTSGKRIPITLFASLFCLIHFSLLIATFSSRTLRWNGMYCKIHPRSLYMRSCSMASRYRQASSSRTLMPLVRT